MDASLPRRAREESIERARARARAERGRRTRASKNGSERERAAVETELGSRRSTGTSTTATSTTYAGSLGRGEAKEGENAAEARETTTTRRPPTTTSARELSGQSRPTTRPTRETRVAGHGRGGSTTSHCSPAWYERRPPRRESREGEPSARRVERYNNGMTGGAAKGGRGRGFRPRWSPAGRRPPAPRRPWGPRRTSGRG